MRKRNLFSGLLILLGCALFIITGCSSALTEDAAGPARSRVLISDPPVFVESLTLEIGDEPVYYDLATGEVVDPETDPWDFGVEYQWEEEAFKGSGLVFFYTNSGVSAITGGGGVWFTDKTVFSSVRLSDAVTNFSGAYAEYAPYVADVPRYAQGMGGNVYETPMNMMTYFGFPGGDGLTDGTPFQIIPYTPPITDYVFYSFNKRAAYTDLGNMPPELAPTGQVYIIKHHYDARVGDVYSKLQVTDFALDPYDLSYSISFQFTVVQ
jgi:hypothetical protein